MQHELGDLRIDPSFIIHLRFIKVGKKPLLFSQSFVKNPSRSKF